MVNYPEITQHSSRDAIKPPVMQPDLSVRAEVTFLVLIALQYLGYIVANIKEKAKVITFMMICQHCNCNIMTRMRTRVLELHYTDDDYKLNMTEESFLKCSMFSCSYSIKAIY